MKVAFVYQGPPSSLAFHFSPDGKAVAFLVVEDGIYNIWLQPLDGSKPHQLTNFNNTQILQDFRWSPDGKTLAILRFKKTADAILLRDTGGGTKSTQ